MHIDVKRRRGRKGSGSRSIVWLLVVLFVVLCIGGIYMCMLWIQSQPTPIIKSPISIQQSYIHHHDAISSSSSSSTSSSSSSSSYDDNIIPPPPPLPPSSDDNIIPPSPPLPPSSNTSSLTRDELLNVVRLERIRRHQQHNSPLPSLRVVVNEHHHHTLRHVLYDVVNGVLPSGGCTWVHMDTHSGLVFPDNFFDTIANWNSQGITESNAVINVTLLQSAIKEHFVTTINMALSRNSVLQSAKLTIAQLKRMVMPFWEGRKWPTTKLEIEAIAEVLSIADPAPFLIMMGFIRKYIWIKPKWKPPKKLRRIVDSWYALPFGKHNVTFGIDKHGKYCTDMTALSEKLCDKHTIRTMSIEVHVVTLESAVKKNLLYESVLHGVSAVMPLVFNLDSSFFGAVDPAFHLGLVRNITIPQMRFWDRMNAECGIKKCCRRRVRLFYNKVEKLVYTVLRSRLFHHRSPRLRRLARQVSRLIAATGRSCAPLALFYRRVLMFKKSSTNAQAMSLAHLLETSKFMAVSHPSQRAFPPRLWLSRPFFHMQPTHLSTRRYIGKRAARLVRLFSMKPFRRSRYMSRRKHQRRRRRHKRPHIKIRKYKKRRKRRPPSIQQRRRMSSQVHSFFLTRSVQDGVILPDVLRDAEWYSLCAIRRAFSSPSSPLYRSVNVSIDTNPLFDVSSTVKCAIS